MKRIALTICLMALLAASFFAGRNDRTVQAEPLVAAQPQQGDTAKANEELARVEQVFNDRITRLEKIAAVQRARLDAIESVAARQAQDRLAAAVPAPKAEPEIHRRHRHHRHHYHRRHRSNAG